MNKTTLRAQLRALRNDLGVRFVRFYRGGGGVVAELREDKAVDLFLGVLAGERLPDAAARALAQAEPGKTDMTATVVAAAQKQIVADADALAAQEET